MSITRDPSLNITHERLLQLLHYDPATGYFSWRIRLSPKCKLGVPLTGPKQNGYVLITIDGLVYRAHRLAWFYVHGRWPANQIDHRNGVRHDNRIDNLREADSLLNNQNRHVAQRRSKSGVLGVTSAAYNRFVAKIHHSGRVEYLGTFDTPEEAGAAYQAAKQRLNLGGLAA